LFLFYEKMFYGCICASGFEGKNCEKRIDYCKVYEPCANFGACSNSLNEPFYQCTCAKGWQGPNCTDDIDECAHMKNNFIIPCSSSGHCINTKGSYSCVCDEFHYGDDCEFTHICDQFESKPCKNGAVCMVAGESVEQNLYECKCAFGYTGTNCTFATCDVQPCEHQSTCEMHNETAYTCNCTGTGYAGIHCETLVNHTECRQTACFGNRTCDPLVCDCDSIDCDEVFLRMRSRPREILYHLILWPLLGIMLALLIILMSVFLMRVKKSRATRGTYSPSRHEQQSSRIEFNMDLKRPPEERLI
jgi:hypothetical protein